MNGTAAMATTISTMLISVGTLLVIATVAVLTYRWQRRNDSVARIGYAFGRSRTVGIDPDRDTENDEAYETEVLLSNLSPFAVAEDKFVKGPIEVRMNARVLQVELITSKPAEQQRPRKPAVSGKRVVFEPFAFCVGREVRIRVRTAEAPRDLLVQADAPEVVFKRIRWRNP